VRAASATGMHKISPASPSQPIADQRIFHVPSSQPRNRVENPPTNPPMNLALAHPLRRLLCLVTLSWMASSLSGCKPADPAQVSEPPAPKISGSQIVFPANAPQLSYLTSEPATETVTAAVGLYGRLAWDDDVTVRVFSPVSGRVQGIPVEVNQPVAVGDALALLDSPDFDQALADARTAVGNFAAADKAFSRAQELLAHGAAAQKDVEAAEAAFIAARAESDRAQARLANYGGHLDSTNSLFALRSPAWSLRRTSPPARKSAPT